ncbi:MAG: Galactose/methyl galactoside import ATP-binding protein MglA [Lentisphaerae bacterium ADurb.BinA184]|nr:MAG: Galactose/methyl galactoside import ATP-binding protein MglA [Lentisphaerae bacterium ADurb.BinA184]
MPKKIAEVILDLQNISLRFGGVKALTDISFNVKEHEIRAIIGPNGAGKTTIFNMITGLFAPTEGDILFQGKSIVGLKPYNIAQAGRHIGGHPPGLPSPASCVRGLPAPPGHPPPYA